MINCSILQYRVQCSADRPVAWPSHCTRYTVNCTFDPLHDILYTIHNTMYTLDMVHCTWYTIPCMLYLVHCSLYNVYYTRYTVSSTVYLQGGSFNWTTPQNHKSFETTESKNFLCQNCRDPRCCHDPRPFQLLLHAPPSLIILLILNQAVEDSAWALVPKL